MTIGSFSFAAAFADDSVGRHPTKVNPFPEDEAAKPVATSAPATATTGAKATAVIKPGRSLVWRSADPAAESDATTADAKAEAPPTTPAKTEAAKSGTTVMQVKAEAPILDKTKSVMAQPAQFVAPVTAPTEITSASQPTLQPALPGRALSSLPEASHPETKRELVATQVALKVGPTPARPVSEPLPAPMRTDSLSMQQEPGMLPPGYYTPTPEAPSPQPPQARQGGSPNTQYDSCDESNSKCQAAWDKFRKDTILDNDVGIAPHPLAGAGTAIQGRDYPCECILPRSAFEPRCWQPSTYEWLASAACYKPLYFEESSLERYGHTCHPILQPFVSGAHFFATFPILPYKMGLETPCECIYPLGTYRPGDCAPWICEGVPLSIRGSLLEAGAWVGGAAIIP